MCIRDSRTYVQIIFIFLTIVSPVTAHSEVRFELTDLKCMFWRRKVGGSVWPRVHWKVTGKRFDEGAFSTVDTKKYSYWLIMNCKQYTFV